MHPALECRSIVTETAFNRLDERSVDTVQTISALRLEMRQNIDYCILGIAVLVFCATSKMGVHYG
jgi:hypothetical protein